MPNTGKKLGEESIHHFSHKHELFFYRAITDDSDNDKLFIDRRVYGMNCDVCGSEILTNEEYLSCGRCRFHMHKSCAELPRKLKHPFHQQHSLTLLDEPPWRKGKRGAFCCACGEWGAFGFMYECSECEFYIHSKCAMLFPTTRLLPAKHQKLRHPHLLIVCERKIVVERHIVDFRCGGCHELFDDHRKGEIDHSTLIYVCLECQVLLHESCADLPQNITRHPLQPDCTLTFRIGSVYDPGRYVTCDFCRHKDSRLYFQCSDCSKKMDIPCALLTPCTATNYKPVGEQKDNGHPHPMIHCNIHVNHYGSRKCNGCERPLEKSAYCCISCKLFLHESCAHLPHQIQHPFHPHHPLTLSDCFRDKEYFICTSCRGACEGFAYQCHPCKFSLDLKCISPPFYPMIYMLEVHQHPLVFSDIKNQYFTCPLCEPYSYRSKPYMPSLRCIECNNFEIHAHCFPVLPPTVKALWHRHPLTLTRRGSSSLSETLYCDVCEDGQSPDDPSYNCVECDLASHVHCVISEVMNYWQEKATSVVELLGDTKLLVFDQPITIGSISVAEMNDEDFDRLLSVGRKKIETVAVEFQEHVKECAKLSAKLKEKEAKREQASRKLRELEGKRDLLIAKRSTRLQFQL